MASNLFDSLPCTETLLRLAYSVKADELAQVCAAYNCTMPELEMELSKLLYESGMHMGACNHAIDFLILAVSSQEATGTLKQAIRASILTSDIYYANVMGGDPIYKQSLCN